MSHLIAEFLNPGRRVYATHALAALGTEAIGVIASVLDGSAKNEFGVPYRTFGEAQRCALVTARLLGRLAAPLEIALSRELQDASPTIRAEAAAALGMLEGLSEETVARLASILEDKVDPACEAAAALIRSGLDEHASVREVVGRSPRAARMLALAQSTSRNR